MPGRSLGTVAAFALAAAIGLPRLSSAADLLHWRDGGLFVGGEVSGSGAVGDDGWFNETEYNRSLMHLFRVGLTAEVRANERLAVLSEVRSENLYRPSVYALYVRLRPWPKRSFDVQAGRIPPVFGAFARRYYAADNPLIGYPLVYQYLTTVRPDVVPRSASDLLSVRGQGWRVLYPNGVGVSYVDAGSSLVSALRWDTGIEAHVGSVSNGSVEGALAVTQGTLSDPLTSDSNGGKQVSARVAVRPAFGLVIGASAASGEFLSREVTDALPPGTVRRGRQQALGLDVDWSRGYWIVRAEGVFSQWDIPPLQPPLVKSPLRALGGFVEARYKIAPGLYVAARADHLGMSAVSAADIAPTWDAPVTRVEAGVGYSPLRRLWLKAVFQQNWRDGGEVRRQSVGAVQASYGF